MITGVGNGLIVIVVLPPVNPVVSVQPRASVTDTMEYVVVLVTGVVATANGVPLTTPGTLWLAVPSL